MSKVATACNGNALRPLADRPEWLIYFQEWDTIDVVRPLRKEHLCDVVNNLWVLMQQHGCSPFSGGISANVPVRMHVGWLQTDRRKRTLWKLKMNRMEADLCFCYRLYPANL
jgi:hypothetical protein